MRTENPSSGSAAIKMTQTLTPLCAPQKSRKIHNYFSNIRGANADNTGLSLLGTSNYNVFYNLQLSNSATVGLQLTSSNDNSFSQLTTASYTNNGIILSSSGNNTFVALTS